MLDIWERPLKRCEVPADKLMMRAYALGQGASTQAFVGITWMLISGTEATGFLRDVLMTSAWLINLSVTEYLIRGRSKSPRLAFAR